MYNLLEKVFDADDTAEPLSATDLYVNKAWIQVKRSNGNPVEIGDSTLESGKGRELFTPQPGTKLDEFPVESTPRDAGNNLNLKDLHGLGKAGEGLNIFYEVW
jgi:hypothetical protein